MTLAEFRLQTSALDGLTEIHVLSPWGDIEAAAWVNRDDLDDEDPVRDQLTDHAILLTGDAD